VAILGGIIPLKSAKMATWLNEKLPGVHVPQALRRQLERASGLEAEVETGVEIAARTIRDLAEFCDGVHVMALGGETHIPAMLRRGGVRR
jgi:methylenetetrahydrofolate reductase (NADPH)